MTRACVTGVSRGVEGRLQLLLRPVPAPRARGEGLPPHARQLHRPLQGYHDHGNGESTADRSRYYAYRSPSACSVRDVLSRG